MRDHGADQLSAVSVDRARGSRDQGNLPDVRLIYFGIFAAALIVRIFGLSTQNFWVDEHWTLKMASVPIAELPDLLPAAESNKPPLYFALMHYWIKAGAGEFWLRLPSAICGALDCAVVAALGRQLLARRTGLWLGLLLTLAPFHIYYSQEARPFALWSLFTSLAFLFHLRFCASRRLLPLIGYSFCALLACYTFTYGCFILPLSISLGLIYQTSLSKRDRAKLVIANSLVLLLYLPWLRTVLLSLVHGIGFQSIHHGPPYAASAYALFTLGLGISAGPSLEKLQTLGTGVFRQAPVGGAMLLFGCLLLATLVSYGLLLLWRTNRNAFYFSLVGVFTFWGMAALLNLSNRDIPLNPRYAYPALIPLMVPILAVMLEARGKGRWRCLLPALFLFTISGSLANHYFNPQYRRDDLRGAAQYLDALQPPAEQIIVCAAHLREILDYYLISEIPIEPLTIRSKACAQASLRLIHQRLTGVQRFALVYSRPDHGDPERALPAAIQTHYQLLQSRHWTGVDVFVFEASRAAY